VSERQQQSTGPRVNLPRCPFCHERIEAEGEKQGCGQCMAWHHAECWAEGGGKCSACSNLRTESVSHGKEAPRRAASSRATFTVLATLAALLVCLMLFVAGQRMAARDPDVATQVQRIRELPATEDGGEKLMQALSHPIPEVRVAAVGRLLEFELASDERKALWLGERLANDRDRGVRREAASALRTLGPAAKAALPMMLQALERDEVWAVRRGVALALREVGPAGREALPELIAALPTQQHRVVRADLLSALVEIAPGAPGTVGAFVEAFEDEHVYVRKRALVEARRLEVEPEALLPALEAHLARIDDPARIYAAAAILSVGGAAPELEAEARAVQDEGVRRLLAELREAPAGESLVEAIKGEPFESHREKNLTSLAAAYLGQLGPVASQALWTLDDVATSHDAEHVRRSAAEAAQAIRGTDAD
jgi:HEAT repeat protein